MPNKPDFGKRVDGPAGRRRAERKPVQVALSLLSLDQSRVVLVTDISAIGCRIKGTGLPEVGREVLLKATEGEFFGTVVWAVDVERGIAFDEPIAEEQVQRLKEDEAWQIHQSLKRES